MTPEIRILAEQITALPGWKWLPGLCVVNPNGLRVWTQSIYSSMPDWLPDLTDPATGGVLLRMMEQAEPDVELSRTPGGPHKDAPWCALASPDAAEWVTGDGATFGEAIARLAVKRGGWT